MAGLMAPLGETVTTNSGAGALAQFQMAMNNSAPFDLVTLDISMPDMDGRTVLRQMRRAESAGAVEPPATIIMTTAKMNKSVILDAIDSGCSDYITKPVSQARLMKKLRALGFSPPDRLARQDTKIHPVVVGKIIDRFHKGKILLPVIPGIVRDIQQVLAKKDASVQELASVIEKEPVVSGKLIRIANSPFFQGRHAVTDLRAAIVRLGTQATHAIVSAITNKALFDADNPSLKKILDRLWQHSFATACCGKMIADKISPDSSDTLFLMGITYDIGNTLLIKAISDFSPDTCFEDTDLMNAVYEIHTTFGADLLKKWKFPELFVRAAALHHWEDFPPDIAKEILVLNLADRFAESIGFGFPDMPVADRRPGLAEKKKIAQRLGLPDLNPEQLSDLQNNTREMIEQSIRAF